MLRCIMASLMSVALALMLHGCGSGDGSEPTPAPSITPRPTPAPTPSSQNPAPTPVDCQRQALGADPSMHFPHCLLGPPGGPGGPPGGPGGPPGGPGGPPGGPGAPNVSCLCNRVSGVYSEMSDSRTVCDSDAVWNEAYMNITMAKQQFCMPDVCTADLQRFYNGASLCGPHPQCLCSVVPGVIGEFEKHSETCSGNIGWDRALTDLQQATSECGGAPSKPECQADLNDFHRLIILCREDSTCVCSETAKLITQFEDHTALCGDDPAWQGARARIHSSQEAFRCDLPAECRSDGDTWNRIRQQCGEEGVTECHCRMIPNLVEQMNEHTAVCGSDEFWQRLRTHVSEKKDVCNAPAQCTSDINEYHALQSCLAKPHADRSTCLCSGYARLITNFEDHTSLCGAVPAWAGARRSMTSEMEYRRCQWPAACRATNDRSLEMEEVCWSQSPEESRACECSMVPNILNQMNDHDAECSQEQGWQGLRMSMQGKLETCTSPTICQTDMNQHSALNSDCRSRPQPEQRECFCSGLDSLHTQFENHNEQCQNVGPWRDTLNQIQSERGWMKCDWPAVCRGDDEAISSAREVCGRTPEVRACLCAKYPGLADQMQNHAEVCGILPEWDNLQTQLQREVQSCSSPPVCQQDEADWIAVQQRCHPGGNEPRSCICAEYPNLIEQFSNHTSSCQTLTTWDQKLLFMQHQVRQQSCDLPEECYTDEVAQREIDRICFSEQGDTDTIDWELVKACRCKPDRYPGLLKQMENHTTSCESVESWENIRSQMDAFCPQTVAV